MKLIQKQLREVLRYDPETGHFTWLVHRTGCRGIGEKAGTLSNGYVQICLYQIKYGAHRLAWLWTYGVLPKGVDHINRERNDNRIANLRLANQSQNTAWGLRTKRSKTGFRGVKPPYGRRLKWQARIKAAGQEWYLGGFASAKEAALAYDAAAQKHFGEFARTNKSMGFL